MSQPANATKKEDGVRPDDFAPGGPETVATRAPESLGGGLQNGGQQVGGTQSPAGDLTSSDEDLFTDDGKEGE